MNDAPVILKLEGAMAAGEKKEGDTLLVHVANLAMAAHSAATSNSIELRMHREECSATRLRNEAVFSDIRQTIGSINGKIDRNQEKTVEKIDSKFSELNTTMETKTGQLSAAQSSSNKWLYMIVGGLQLAGSVGLAVMMHLWGK